MTTTNDVLSAEDRQLFESNPQLAMEKWDGAVKAVTEWKLYERALRDIVVEQRSSGAIEDGTENVDTEKGKLKMKHTATYKLANKEFETQNLCNSLPLATQVTYFSWDAKLKLKAFKDLRKIVAVEKANNVTESESQTLLRQIEEVLTITPGTAQVELKAGA